MFNVITDFFCFISFILCFLVSRSSYLCTSFYSFKNICICIDNTYSWQKEKKNAEGIKRYIVKIKCITSVLSFPAPLDKGNQYNELQRCSTHRKTEVHATPFHTSVGKLYTPLHTSFFFT